MGRKGKETTEEERKIIINLRNTNKTIKEISEIVKRPKSTITSILHRFDGCTNYKNKDRDGRPKKLTERESRKLIQIVKKNPKITSSKIAGQIKEMTGKDIHPRTVRRTLHSAGYSARVCRKKPCITKINKEKRLVFAKEYINKENDFWDAVIWSDESKFNIYKSDGRILVWRKEGTELQQKHIQRTVKHGGGSVMVWGCMAASGVGELVFIDGIMKKEQYLDILRNNLKKSAEKLNLSDSYYFQQDNDPKHTAEMVRLWILYNTPHTLKTPPQSPDLNPIEHLWDILDRRVREHHISSQNQLKNVLREEWGKITEEVTRNLVQSMPNRLRDVIKQKGYQTKY